MNLLRLLPRCRATSRGLTLRDVATGETQTHYRRCVLWRWHKLFKIRHRYSKDATFTGTKHS